MKKIIRFGSIQGRVFREQARPGQTKRALCLLAAFALLVAAVIGVSRAGKWEHCTGYQTQLAAAQRMEQCMEAVRGYKAERGLPYNAEDYHHTGMLGGEFNMMTTTSGAPDAKRTTANSDMAALAVRMLGEAGVRRGGKVALGLSGSFPAMNVAVLCACAELDLQTVVISSVGASTYGANQPELTFPEMYSLLIRDGLLPDRLAAVTWGGGGDCAGGMDEALVEQVRQRLAALGITPHVEPDWTKNMEWRMRLYEADGMPDCFVSVGGNLTSLGRDQPAPPQGLLLPRSRLSDRGEKNGMLERYHIKGVPVISFLGIKQLVTEYGLPFDPPVLPEPGKSAVYYIKSYPKWPILPALFASGILIWIYARKRGGV